MTKITYRSLALLSQSASSSRVLNLNNRSNFDGFYVEDLEPPFFLSKTLNRGIIIKHRLRSHEYSDDMSKRVVTKVVIPLVATDLKLGGQYFFVSQAGFHSIMESFNEVRVSDADRDRRLLELIDELPSLDPFLLKEQLSRNGFEVGDSYFNISESDMRAMNGFVAKEIEPLVRLSIGLNNVSQQSVARLAHKILNSVHDDEMGPIRQAFRMTAEDFRVSIFAWKGFLYYKWKMRTEMPAVTEVANQIKNLAAARIPDPYLREPFVEAQAEVVRMIHAAASDIFRALRLYEDSFANFVRDKDALGFAHFLTVAPTMFEDVGGRLGVLSHIQTYWNYLYGNGKRITDFEQLNDLLQEWRTSLEFEPLGDEVARALKAPLP